MSEGGANVWFGTIAAESISVGAIRGQEGLSRLYRFDLDLRTDVDLLSVDPPLLGSPGMFTWTTDNDLPVTVQGIVSAISARGIDQNEKRLFTVRLSPRLALLKRRKTTRIFQDLSVVDIITRVLDGHAIPKVWTLAKKYPIRSYCVQYQETDYDFVVRLCAEAGIYFYFLQPTLGDTANPESFDGLGEQVVFCDEVQHYPPMMSPGASFLPSEAASKMPSPALPFRSAGALGKGEYLEEFDYRRSVRPQSVSLRDYDFLRPMLDLNAGLQADRDETKASNQLPGAAPARSRGPLEVYEHHGEYSETDVSSAYAQTLLESHRARAIVAKGKGTCRRLTAGRRFHIENHPVAELDGIDFVIVRVNHSYSFANDKDAYSNTFECVPASVAYRPKRKARSLAQVLETAEVVGPVGETIHTDVHGRIKVQFHWDREGVKNEHSSCWMRVSQPWAGSSWGMQFIPRVGDEVLVSFIGGDEDRPVVMGSVYNATHPPPFPLPLSKTKSGIMTHSVGGPGSNELSFEDGAGAELVTLRSQRTLREVAGNDHLVDVAGEQTTNVVQSQNVSVGSKRSVRVDGDETHSVGGTSSVNIARDHQVSIGGRRIQNVGGSDTIRSHGTNIVTNGNYAVNVDGSAIMSVGTEERPTTYSVKVHGPTSHDSTDFFTICSETRIKLQAGASSITLTDDGVRIDARKIVVRAKEQLVLMGDGPAIELGKDVEVLADKIRMFSEGGSVELDAEAAHVDGPLVKLNCGAGRRPEIEDEVEEAKTQHLRWRCLDENLKPYKNKTYHLDTLGMRLRGTTDEDGFVEHDIPIDATAARLILWKESFPQGERITYNITLGRLPPANGAYGALIRLRNLGYYTGPDVNEATPELNAALLAFQIDHRLKTTGKLDADTADKLEEVHP